MILVEDVLAGKRLAIARLLTQVENKTDEANKALSDLFPHTGKAHIIGITGAPGTGKSSLVNAIVYVLRNNNPLTEPPKIAVLTVDPTSPFSGGAILGDRIRMTDIANDPGVFIRSMATRGALGGLAATTSAMTQVFDAAGYPYVIIETVGAGQSEVEIAHQAHTTIVVDIPGMGDDIQAIKSGIMEIADIFVINKADYPGVEETERILRTNLQYTHLVAGKSSVTEFNQPWDPPIVCTIAPTKDGIEELINQIYSHRQWLEKTSARSDREALKLSHEFEEYLRVKIYKNWRAKIPEELFDGIFSQVLTRKISPYQAVNSLLEHQPDKNK